MELQAELETMELSGGKVQGWALCGPSERVLLGTSSVDGDGGPAQGGGWERQAVSGVTV